MRSKKQWVKWTGAVLVAASLAIGIWMVTINMTNTNEESNRDLAYSGHGGTFKNTLAEIDTPDPSIVYKDGYYYMTFTHNGTDVMVMKSRTMDFRQAARKVVWYPPLETMYSANIWAPEIQYLQGKWYIYFAADNGVNENHRMYVLEADTDDPLGKYTFKGQVKDETDRWAIDGIALEHQNKLYFIWSGWEGDVNIQQNTYIAPMSDPLTISGPRVLIGEPTLEWEKAGGPPYIHEGQAILKKEGRVFLMYSGAGSWTPFYSIGTLLLEPGNDPLIASNWKKFDQPLLTMDDNAGVYGPGHNTFVSSPDGTEDWIVYHATSGIYDGWNNRKARAQKIEWRASGLPHFGKPLSLQTAIEVPSGSGVFRADDALQTDGQMMFDLIVASQDSDAPLLIHYRNESDLPSSVQLAVGQSQAGSYELPPTNEGQFGFKYASVKLASGMNTISLSYDSHIQIVAIELPRYEAENARTENDAVAEENPFTSGWGVARMDDSRSAVHFDNVNVPITGTYKVRFAISNPSDKKVTVHVAANSDKSKKLQLPPTERNVFSIIESEISLKAGVNAIILKNTTGLIMVDYMDIVR